MHGEDKRAEGKMHGEGAGSCLSSFQPHQEVLVSDSSLVWKLPSYE